MCECVCRTKPQDKALVKTLSVHFHRTVSRSSGPDGCKWYQSAHDRCLLCVRWWRNQRSCSTPWASQLKHNKSQKVLRQFGLKFYCSIFAKCWAVWGFILTTFFISQSWTIFKSDLCKTEFSPGIKRTFKRKSMSFLRRDGETDRDLERQVV